jgi:hypothetical protein
VGRRVPVAAPDGHAWSVRRCWAPHLRGERIGARIRRRLRQSRRRGLDAVDADPGCFDAIGDGIAAAIAVIVIGAVMFFIVWPLLVAVVELLVLAVIVLVGVAARVCFGHPWTIEARRDDGTVLRWRVTGWRASGQRRHDVESMLAAGLDPGAEEAIEPVDGRR